MAAAEEAIHEVEEEVFGGFVEEGFTRGRAEGDLVLTREGAGDEGVADAGVFEAVEGEGNFGSGARTDFSGGEEVGREQSAEMVEGYGGAIERGCGVERVGKLDGEVAVVSDGGGREFGGGGAEFIKLPLGEGGVEPGHAGAGSCGKAGGDDDAESMHDAAAGGVFTALFEPENAEGEGAIDDGGWFFGADADDGPGRLAFGEEAASIGGAEAVLGIHGGTERFGRPARKLRREGLLEGAQITAAGSIARGGGAEVGIGDEGEGLRFGLAEAMGFEAEGIAARLDGGDGADEIAVLGPEMEEAAAVVGGDGAAGEAEIEKEAAVFEDGGVGMIGEEVFDGVGERGGDGGGGWCSGGKHLLRWSAPAAMRSKRKATSPYAFVIRRCGQCGGGSARRRGRPFLPEIGGRFRNDRSRAATALR
jgi:hypothetical protein